MTRFSILALALVLAACEPAPRPSPEALSEAYAEALRDGDVGRALDALDARAEAGDLHALAELADTRSRGYLRFPYQEGITPGNHAIWTWPWSGPRATRRFEAVLQDSVAAGSHDALFLLADRHLSRTFDGEGVSASDTTAARAIYERLASEGARVTQVAFLAQRLGDEDAYQRHLTDGAAAGDPQACLFHHFATGSASLGQGAAGLAATIDEVEGCAARAPERAPPTRTYGEQVVGSLVEQRDLGNEAAAATLDSLHTLGLFDRHPHLGAIVAEAG